MFGKPNPEDISPGSGVEPGDIDSIVASTLRLPVRFANEIYRAGQSGFGQTSFTLVFSLGFRRTYTIAGLFVDFLEYPLWLGPNNVRRVILYPTKRIPRMSPAVRWCVLDEDLGL